MTKSISRLVMIAVLTLGVLGAARVAFADDGDMGAVVCCSDGGPCAQGEACCKKKAPATDCSSTQPMQCVANAGDCAY